MWILRTWLDFYEWHAGEPMLLLLLMLTIRGCTMHLNRQLTTLKHTHILRRAHSCTHTYTYNSIHMCVVLLLQSDRFEMGIFFLFFFFVVHPDPLKSNNKSNLPNIYWIALFPLFLNLLTLTEHVTVLNI